MMNTSQKAAIDLIEMLMAENKRLANEAQSGWKTGAEYTMQMTRDFADCCQLGDEARAWLVSLAQQMDRTIQDAVKTK